MKILAMETTGAAASVCVRGADGMPHTLFSSGGMDHLQSLMPLTKQLLEEQNMTLADLNAIAVSAGPGSFTGIRIGMAAAKTIGQIMSLPVIPVMTLGAYIYSQAVRDRKDALLCPMIDARRKTVYAAAYHIEEGAAAIEAGCFALEDFLSRSLVAAEAAGVSRLIFAGSGADQYRNVLEGFDFSGLEWELVPEMQAAAAEILCGAERSSAVEDPVPLDEIEPVYLKKAEAEEKRRAGLLGRKKKKVGKEAVMDLPPEDEPVDYRAVSAEEAQRLAELDAECFREAWSADSFRGDLEGARTPFYCGAYNPSGRLIGFAGLVCLADEAELNRVAVHPLYRNRGIAGGCLDRILEQARGAGVNRIWLEVREANRSAIGLYKEHGFRVIGKRVGYYRSTGENALVMECKREEHP